MLATVPTHPSTDIDRAMINAAGHAADRAASLNIFAAYQIRKAVNTNRRHANDLRLFGDYLAEMELYPGDLYQYPPAWHGITWGIVAGFVQWLGQRGYAVASINMRLSTVKVYARLAAGALGTHDHVLISTVAGYSRKEGARLDDTRSLANQPTRNGRKKALAVAVSPEQARALKTQPNTPQGRRDALMLCIMLDHGLRVGEVVILTVSDFDLRHGMITFYRPKVDKTQTHKMTADTLAAAHAYITCDAPALGCIWRASASHRDGRAAAGTLTSPGASVRGASKRVATLGTRVGISGLSAHDLRHYWATDAARHGTPIDVLMAAGGWSSYAMPLRYIESAHVANAGVILS